MTVKICSGTSTARARSRGTWWFLKQAVRGARVWLSEKPKNLHKKMMQQRSVHTFTLSFTHPLHILFLSKRNWSINTMLAFFALRFTLFTWTNTHTNTPFVTCVTFCVFRVLFRKCTFGQSDYDEDDDVPWLARRGISSVYTTHTTPLWLMKVLEENTVR